jgi:A/G-specific adenine glycosylase
LVSEFMLQQTRAETVIPYYERWLRRFPDLRTLAESPLEEVLKLWEGLGYYRRADHLWQAARQIISAYNGQIPSDPAELARLPGIGPYTAGAIASIAFGADAAALDGNIRRVLTRVFALEEPPGTPAAQRRLAELAASELPAGHAGEFNQALMDLGATVCTPHAPRCEDCPLAELCAARAQDRQEELPHRAARRAIPLVHSSAAVILRAGRVLIVQRPRGGLLGGMWEFPNDRIEPGETPERAVERLATAELAAQVTVGASLGVYKHAYTHFREMLYAFRCTLSHGEPVSRTDRELRWVTPDELAGYPMGKLARQAARTLTASEG